MNATAASSALPPAIGKTARNEDYPFGSLLLAAHLRPHVGAFYRFARHADDIADSPGLAPIIKLERLDALAAVLDGFDASGDDARPAMVLRESLRATGLDDGPARELLAAFRWDAQGGECVDWDDLLAYCRLSAAPVGRYMLALHGESPRAFGAADALCSAVQILNHVQDCRADFVHLGRTYLPRQWMRSAGVSVTDLGQTRCSDGLRRLLDRTLDGVRGLLHTSETLPAMLEDRRLRAEAAVIIAIAKRLELRLRKADPLRGRIAPSLADGAAGLVAGLWRAVRAR